MTPERKAAGIGVVTLLLGLPLLVAPEAVGRKLGWPAGHDGGLRLVGASDLILVPGLLRGRPRWPWMVARMSFNVLLGAWAARLGTREGGRVPWAVAAAMVALTAADSTITRPLVAERR